MREICELPVKLNEQEVLGKADQLVAKMASLHDLEEKKKLDAKQAKDEIEALERKAKKLAREIADRAELRQVDCRWERDNHRSSMVLYRTDTGEVVRARPMTADELADKQVTLFDADRKPAAE
jgi:hypothetical protein